MKFDEWEKNIIGQTGGKTLEENFYADQYDIGQGAAMGREMSIRGQQEEEARRRAHAASQQAAAQERQKLEDKYNPSKARMVPKDDGGYDFYDGAGEKINVFNFSQLTGARPDDILKDSYNPRDQQFVQEYGVLRQFTSAMANNDNEMLSKMRAADPDKFNELTTQYQKPAELISAFKDRYSEYFSDRDPDHPTQPRASNFLPINKVQVDNETLQGLLSETTAQDTLRPIAPDPEPEGSAWARFLNPQQNFRDEGLAAIAGGGWLWGGEADRRKQWEDRINSNPWARYRHNLGKGNQ